MLTELRFPADVLLEHAKSHGIDMESLTLDYDVLTAKEVSTLQPHTVYLKGLYLKGARWDTLTNKIVEANDGKIVELPLVAARPTKTSKTLSSTWFYYPAPLFKSMTMVDDNNLLATLKLPTDSPEKHWILRGTTLFTDKYDQ